MSTYSRSPKLLKGALVKVSATRAVMGTVAFQYNPETLSRSLTPQQSGGTGAPVGALRLGGAPQEQIQLTAEIDATDGLERGDPNTQSMGIHPQLAALESLLYPDIELISSNDRLISQGQLEIVPPESPLTLFVWGVNRVLPVRVGNISVEETFYDQLLNPIHASVNLQLTVLGYDDLPSNHVGRALFMQHHAAKEQLGYLGTVQGLEGVLPGQQRF